MIGDDDVLRESKKEMAAREWWEVVAVRAYLRPYRELRYDSFHLCSPVVMEVLLSEWSGQTLRIPVFQKHFVPFLSRHLKIGEMMGG